MADEKPKEEKKDEKKEAPKAPSASNIKTFDQAENYLYTVRQMAKREQEKKYDDKKPTDLIKGAIEKMVANAETERQADSAYASAKKHGHYVAEAYDKFCKLQND